MTDRMTPEQMETRLAEESKRRQKRPKYSCGRCGGTGRKGFLPGGVPVPCKCTGARLIRRTRWTQ